MARAETKEAIGVTRPEASRAQRKGGTQALFRWTIAAVLASWVLNLITFWLSWEQHRDAKELLGVQISVELEKEFNSTEMRRARRMLASQALDKVELTEDRVLDFFDTVGMYLRQGRVDDETVYATFSYWVERYWPVHEEIVKRLRTDEHDDGLYQDFEDLYQRMLSADAKEHTESVARVRPTSENIEKFLKEERELTP